MKVKRLFYIAALMVLAISCTPQVPDKYLQPDEFEDILYDYHLADAMANNSGDVNEISYNVTFYRQAVLRKYGITQAEFDSSLVYYTRHSDRLHKIYENISKRLEEDAMALGASANDIRSFGAMTSARDTSNLWTGVPATMLITKAPYNVMSFEIEADSTYREGDKLILSFNCDFLFSDGNKDATALLAVQFKNDSIASNYTRMTSNMRYNVTVNDVRNVGIKTIRGFIYLNNRNRSNSESSSDNELKLLFIDNIRLVRLRTNSTAEGNGSGNGPTNPNDSLSKRNANASKDSLDRLNKGTDNSRNGNSHGALHHNQKDSKPKQFVPSKQLLTR